MKHFAVIQREFIKEAAKWDELSQETQKDYLKRHPKSKRRVTARPERELSNVKKDLAVKKDELKTNPLLDELFDASKYNFNVAGEEDVYQTIAGMTGDSGSIEVTGEDESNPLYSDKLEGSDKTRKKYAEKLKTMSIDDLKTLANTDEMKQTIESDGGNADKILNSKTWDTYLDASRHALVSDVMSENVTKKDKVKPHDYESAKSDIGDILDILSGARSFLEKGDKESFDQEIGDALEISIAFPYETKGYLLKMQYDIKSNIDKLNDVKDVKEFDTIVSNIDALSDKLSESPNVATTQSDSSQVLKKVKSDYTHDEFKDLIKEVANSFKRPLTKGPNGTAEQLSYGMFNSVASNVFNNKHAAPAHILKNDPMFIMQDNFKKAIMTDDKKLKDKYLDTAVSMVDKLTVADKKWTSIPMGQEEIESLKYMLKHKDDEDWQDGYAK